MSTDLELVNNPTTDIYVLTDIANRSPELWPKIAEHPNCSPELAQWVHQMLDYQAKTHVDPQPEAENTEPETQVQPVVEHPKPQTSQATEATQSASPYAPRQIQSAPRQYKSNNSNTGLKVLVIVLAVIAVMAIGFAGWALFSKPTSTQPAAYPAKTVETKADSKTKDKAETDSKKDSDEDNSKDSEKKNPRFDYAEMAKGDYSSANGRWEAPNGDALIIEDDKLTWEHDGKPFRAVYPKNAANSAPKELQADGFTATNEKDFFKIVWKADEDTPRGIVQIIFVQNTFPAKTIFKYDSTKIKGVEVKTQLSYHGTKRSILLLNLDDPENFDSDYQSHSASLVKGTSI